MMLYFEIYSEHFSKASYGILAKKEDKPECGSAKYQDSVTLPSLTVRYRMNFATHSLRVTPKR